MADTKQYSFTGKLVLIAGLILAGCIGAYLEPIIARLLGVK